MQRVSALVVAFVFSAGATAAQSPRDANPERPTYATHAYAVAPGYAELEQGVSARGIHALGDATSWDVNLKFGLSAWAQFALFGPLYLRGPGGGGVGDLEPRSKSVEISSGTPPWLSSPLSLPRRAAWRAGSALVAPLAVSLVW
jgi:hypothetical protein